jgi:hypothetical protein
MRTNNNASRAATGLASDNARHSPDYTPSRTRIRIKALIIGAACWGVLPVNLAEDA